MYNNILIWIEEIRLVQDNVSTHNSSAFYQHLSAAEAFRLSQSSQILLHLFIGHLAEYD
jgi:hypothetical protein